MAVAPSPFTAPPGRFAEEGCRRSAYAALVVSSHKHPHILVLQSSSGAFRLPGGRLRPGEEEADGLKRQLQSLLAPAGALLADWEVGELLGTWRGPGLTKLRPAVREAAPCDRCRWAVCESAAMSFLRHRFRPDYTSDLYPYVPPHVTRPKECLRIYLVHLPDRFLFEIPRNLKLMAVPLFELNDNRDRYGAVIAALPEQLSRFAFHYAQVGSLSAGPLPAGQTRSAALSV